MRTIQKYSYQQKLVFFLLPILLSVFSIGFKSLTKTTDTYYIQGDGFGYYSYLPNFLTHYNSNYNEVIELEKKKLGRQQPGNYLNETEGGKLNKYYCGSALLAMPFYSVASLGSYFMNYKNDGYARPFFMSFFFASVFYFTLGLSLLGRALSNLNYGLKNIAIVLTIIAVGTNAFYYSFYVAFSHAFSFFAFAWLLYYVTKLHDKVNLPLLRNYFVLGFIIGFIIVVRPINIVLTPVVFIFVPELLTKLSISKIAYFLAGFGILIGVQLLTWKLSVGSLFVWSYGGEGFNWLSPNFYQQLIGPRVGVLWYTPVLILSIFGLVKLYKSNRSYVLLGLLLVFYLYLSASWWSWDYGGSLGARYLVDVLPLLAIPIICMLEGNRWVKYKINYIVLVLAVSLNLLKVVQYDRRIIKPSKMTFSSFFYSYFSLSREDRDLVGGCVEPISFGRENMSVNLPVKDFQINPEEQHLLLTHSDVFNGVEENVHIEMELEYTLKTGTSFKGLSLVVEWSDGAGNEKFKQSILPYNLRNGILNKKKKLFCSARIRKKSIDNPLANYKVSMINSGESTVVYKNWKVKFKEYGR